MDEIGTSKEGEPQSSSAAESLSSPSSVAIAKQWRPSQLIFSPYSPDTNAKPQNLRVVVRRPVISRLTKDIVETYKICNPQFQYSEELNPKRFLTSPSIGVLNDGHDNANSDLILAVNLVLVNLETQRRYIVKEILGQGTFGQVAKCWVAETSSFVAVKIIKNQPAYYQQALVEVSILTTLNRKFDPDDRHHIVRIYDYFVYHRHLCITFELLDTNLYELIKINQFRGLSLSIVQLFSKQILRGLSLMKDAGIIHCDLKPENILLCTRGQPPDYVLKEAKTTCKFFKFVGNVNHEEPTSRRSVYKALTEEEYEAVCVSLFLLFDQVRGKRIDISRLCKICDLICLTHISYFLRESKKPLVAKEYFKYTNLEAIVREYPYRQNLSEEDLVKESRLRLALIDFLRGLVEFDPAKRWSPLQASKHPFVTGEPFTCPYNPPPETPRVPVSQNIKVDHHPAGGHWFAAGLSPNIPGMTRVAVHNSPHFHVVPYAHSGSYGSLGSHGSYNDNTGLGSSYGSYGENSNMLAYYSPVGPSGMKGGMPILGSSPDARRRIQLPPGNRLGVSPSAGNFVPMSLGTSPSQFTPPTYSQVGAGSPGQYGPTSPVRGSCHGSPLGPSANQFNRRKSWGYHGSVQSQESSSFPHWQGQVTDSTSSAQAEGNSPVHGSPLHPQSNLNASSWKQQRGGSGITAGYSAAHNFPASLALPNMQSSQPIENARDNPEGSLSLPGPGDWDPNYSEELLLQDDGSDVSCMATEFSRMQLGQALLPTESLGYVRRSNHIAGTSFPSTHRPNGLIQPFSTGEVGSSQSGHDLHGGFARPVTKSSHLMPHSSPSRLGQQPVQRLNHGRSTAGRGSEWNHTKVQPSSSSSGVSHSPGNSLFSNGTSWDIDMLQAEMAMAIIKAEVVSVK
ncbi:hypothetical protein RHGRI_008870 [Rhododendron griersonianum]|uniref:Protein kinase domain-containing protein n=1 Tax=Rhododendron griersonianum TaxID=479676 RepID=A0AAV6L2V4_9ERIC|nr:hypothetical protein RHGRI_008870 [Rhododendron griersonianum]